VWQALTSSDNPKPLNKSHYALAIGSQAYCMGGAGIYTAPTMAGPWSYEGSLYTQMIPEPQVRPQCGRHACTTSIQEHGTDVTQVGRHATDSRGRSHMVALWHVLIPI
jgi:hypothetical protein